MNALRSVWTCGKVGQWGWLWVCGGDIGVEGRWGGLCGHSILLEVWAFGCSRCSGAHLLRDRVCPLGPCMVQE